MGIFDGLLNMFKDTNTTTPTAPAATHQTSKPEEKHEKKRSFAVSAC